MKNVLVTGATGFIGSHLVRRLNEENVRVRIYRRASSDLQKLPDGAYEDCVGGLDDGQAFRKALEGIDTVFHLAAATSLLTRDRAVRQRVNVDNQQIIVNALLGIKSIRLIHTSSVAAIGCSETPDILDEKSPFNAHDLHYFVSKMEGEEITLRAVVKGLDAVIVNPGTVVGALDMHNIQQKIVKKAATGNLLFCPPGGTCFSDIDDVVAGMILAARKGRPGERYILGGHNITYREYVTALAAARNRRPPVIVVPRPILPALGWALETACGRVGIESARLAGRYGYYSSEKAKRELGYTITPLADMIRKILSLVNGMKVSTWAL